MKFKLGIVVLLGSAISISQAQLASHAPTMVMPAAPAPSNAVSNMQVTGRAVVRINGAVLTDRDLLREMLAMFPYARIHNGFPKDQEASIRKGALQMIEFEELVYQEAERRKMTIPAERLKKAEAAYRQRFPNEQEFQRYLKIEMNGSLQQFRKTVRRSLLIEAMLNLEVKNRSRVTIAEAREYYRGNPKKFSHPEQMLFQTISIMPPGNASNEVKEKARKHAEEALQKAQATHNYQEFGLLAEKVSEDDFRVNMGAHENVTRDKLPAEALQVLDGLKPGQVSGICKFDSYYAIFRLQSRTPAAKVPFEQVRAQLMDGLQKDRYNAIRAQLNKKLRATAKVEEL